MDIWLSSIAHNMKMMSCNTLNPKAIYFILASVGFGKTNGRSWILIVLQYSFIIIEVVINPMSYTYLIILNEFLVVNRDKVTATLHSTLILSLRRVFFSSKYAIKEYISIWMYITHPYLMLKFPLRKWSVSPKWCPHVFLTLVNHYKWYFNAL